jgi:hypothetical protein
VTSILAEANEKFDRYYEIKSQGYSIEKREKRVKEKPRAKRWVMPEFGFLP